MSGTDGGVDHLQRPTTLVGSGDSFFPLSPGGTDGETDLRRDILLLTSLLKNVQPGSSAATPSKSAEKALSTWSHISYILSTGDKQSDRYEHKVVAVTGHLEPGDFGHRGGRPTKHVIQTCSAGRNALTYYCGGRGPKADFGASKSSQEASP